MLTTDWLLDHTELSLVLDDEAIYEIRQRNLNMERVYHIRMNRMVAKAVSSMTASLRFEGELNVNLNALQIRIAFLYLINGFRKRERSARLPCDNYPNDVQTITAHCSDARNFLVKISDFDVGEGKYTKISVNYRAMPRRNG